MQKGVCPLCSEVESKSVKVEVVDGRVVYQTFYAGDWSLRPFPNLNQMFLLPHPKHTFKSYLTPGWVFRCRLWLDVSVLFHFWVLEYTCTSLQQGEKLNHCF